MSSHTMTHLCAQKVAGGTFSYTKAFTGALVLTIQESRKFRPTCQKQGNGNAPGDVNAQPALCLADFTWRKDGGHVGYTYMLTSAWGFQRCSFRQVGAMREPLNRGTGNRHGSTFFCMRT